MKAWESVIVARLADNYEKSGLSDGEHNLLEIADRDLKAFRSKAPEVWQELYESDLDSRQIGDWIAGFLKKWSKSGMSLRNFALDELESGRVKLKKSVLYDRSNRTAGRRNRAGEDLKQIVLATVETVQVPVGTWRHDLGERPKMRAELVAKAAMWLRKGSAEDELKAQAHARRSSDEERRMSVHTFPLSEKEPLEKAKREALAAVGATHASSSKPKSSDIVWKGNVAHGTHTVGELSKGYRGWSGIVRQSFGRGSVLDSEGAPTKAEVKVLVTDMMRRWDREVELQGRAAFD